MFPRIDKKFLMILIAILVVFLFAGYFVFKYTKKIETTVQDSIGGANTEESGQTDEKTELPLDEENAPVEILSPQIEIESQPGLFICVDKCGDKICQASDSECKDNLNCICPETKQDCPSDCQ
jgi:hypothetical protein